MPTVQSIPGPYRFFFYSNENNERPHVHVQREKATCKFWLNPVELVSNHGFKNHELNQIRAVIRKEMRKIQEAWNEHFG
jgi:hypothetical protein